MEALRWPFRGPRWFRRIAVMGLLNLVPIAGMMALLGWVLACLDNLRAGRDELPAAGLRHLARGWRLFVVLLVYWMVLILVYAAIAVTGDVARVALDGLALLVYYAGLLAVTALGPQVVLATDAGGLRGGLRLTQVLTRAWARPGPAVAAAALTLVLAVVAHSGLVLCGVGILLTAAYSAPAWAAVIHRYERATT